MRTGIAASPGIAIGPAWVVQEVELDFPTEKVDNPEEQLNRFRGAVDKAKTQVDALREKAKQTMGEDKAAIFEAHLMVLDDPELLGSVEQKIKEERLDAAKAVHDVIEQFVAMFEQMDMEYMRERAADIRDVGSRLVHILLGVEPRSLAEMDDPSVVVAHDLTPPTLRKWIKARCSALRRTLAVARPIRQSWPERWKFRR